MKPINSPSFFIGKNDEDIISFGSGQPDLAPPPEIFKALSGYGDFKYGTVRGEADLRTALAKQYPTSTADNFVVTNGASEALDLTLKVLRRQEDGLPNKVLLARPYYYSYPFMIKFAGLEPVYTDLVEGKIDFADFAAKAKDCKAVIINSPSNPMGTVESIDTLKKIEKLAAELGFYIISDEAYKDIIYERENYLIQGPHVVTVNTFSKTYAMCGLRVGYLWSFDQELVDNVIEMKTHTSMNTNILGQAMALAAATVPRSFINKQTKLWKERRDVLCQGLEELGFDFARPEGAFYVMAKWKNSAQVVHDLYYNHKVIVYDGVWFGAPEYIRFSYALKIEKINEGLKRIKKYLKE